MSLSLWVAKDGGHAFSIKSSVFQAKSFAYQKLFFVVMLLQDSGNHDDVPDEKKQV